MSQHCDLCEKKDDCLNKLENPRAIKDKLIEACKKDGKSKFGNLDAYNLVLCSCALGKHLASREVGLRTSQIRKFLNTVIDMNASISAGAITGDGIKDQALMLEPQLAWAATRQYRQVMPLHDVLVPCIEKVSDKKDFERLTKFIEAVVAYHSFHGGREK
jgi:CRISPR-associated protein Csm2